MPLTSQDENRTPVRTSPTFRYNHPKNYLGVPIAVDAEGSTGALVQAHVVRGAGAAKKGAEELNLIDNRGELTQDGRRIATHAADTYGSARTALEQFEEWRGTTTRLIELDGGVWAGVVPEIVSGYPPVKDIAAILNENGNRLTLPELAHEYLIRWPETARALVVRHTVDLPEDESQAADMLFDAGVYHSGVTCQLKTILYHCGILTEKGSDSTHLMPATDVWELEDDLPHRLGGELR